MTDEPNWEGLPGTTEHRTVGPHRAWAYATAEWCYPDDLCWTCDQTKVPSEWQGERVGYVLEMLHARVVAEAEIARLAPDGKHPKIVIMTHAAALLYAAHLIDGSSDG